jgi:hypothetical protein
MYLNNLGDHGFFAVVSLFSAHPNLLTSFIRISYDDANVLACRHVYFSRQQQSLRIFGAVAACQAFHLFSKTSYRLICRPVDQSIS